MIDSSQHTTVILISQANREIKMINKAIKQIVESVRLTGLDYERSVELALQLLAWEKLSRTDKIARELCFSADFVKNPIKVFNTFQALAASGGLMSKAFGNTPSIIANNPYRLSESLEILDRLSTNGVLNNLDIHNLAELRSTTSTNRFMNMPGEVADLLIGIAAISSKDSVYTPWDSSFAQFASRAAMKTDDVYYESVLQTSIPALVSLLSEREFEVAISDPIKHPTAIEGGRPKLFDVTVAFPPFGIRYPTEELRRDLFNRFPERTQIGSVLAVRHALSQTKSILVIAVQNSVLFSHGYEKELRRDLVERGMIEAVISMPMGLLSQTNIAFTILIINPNGGKKFIKFINADTPEFYAVVEKTRFDLKSVDGLSAARTKNELKNIDRLLDLIKSNKDSPECAIVPVSKVIENDFQLQVDRYVVSESRRQLEKRLSNLNTIQLGDMVRTVRAIPAGLAPERPIAAMEIGAFDLPQFGYIEAKGKTISIDSNLAKRYEDCFLRPLDIVLIVKGSVGKIGLVPFDVPAPGNGGWVAGQSAIVLRVHPEYCAQSLFVQLRSPMGQALLASIVSGATIKLIQLRELMKLEIVKSTPEQDGKSRKTIDAEDGLEKQIKEIKKEQEELSKNIWNL
jgi:type I restriction enzyme M protein